MLDVNGANAEAGSSDAGCIGYFAQRGWRTL
jgi:hypothetical protein